MTNGAPVLIAGAGLAGLSTAFHLGPDLGILVDKEKQAGGTARSYSVDGFTFDYTGHLLHLHNDYTRKLVRRLLKNNFYECRRNTWIHSQGVYTRYPFQANLFGLPAKVIEECILGLWRSRRKYGPDPLQGEGSLPFSQWCDRLFGQGIFRHFMGPYNRKLWQTSLDEMNADWCGQFVPTPKLEDVLAGALADQTRAFGYNADFLYPKNGGIQVLAQALAAEVRDIRLGAALEKIFWKEKRARLSTGEDISYRRLVSTLPLPELLKKLDPFPPELRGPLASLRWTSVMCVNLGVKRAAISDKSWIYFPEEKFVFYRVGFPMNFTPHAAPPGCSSMYVEVSYEPRDRAFAGEPGRARLLKAVRRGLEASGLLKRADVFAVASFLPIPYAYVIYDRNRGPALEIIFPWLKENAGISSIGRYGAWKYSFMEEAILDGKAAAESLRMEM